MPIYLLAYYSLLILISILAIMRWKYFKKGDKIIAFLIFLTICDEGAATFAAYRWHNNMAVYHIYTPIEFLLISLYFNTVIIAFRKKKIGVIVGICGILISLANTLFIQPINSANSNFLLLEGTMVIIYCLLSLREEILDEEHSPYRYAAFWMTLCFLIYWSSTFTMWGFYSMVDVQENKTNPIYSEVIVIANFTFYLGIAAIFLFYKKLKPSGE